MQVIEVSWLESDVEDFTGVTCILCLQTLPHDFDLIPHVVSPSMCEAHSPLLWADAESMHILLICVYSIA